MKRDISESLRSLEQRRKGVNPALGFAMDSASEVLAKSFLVESYTQRAKNKPFTEFTLGSMQAVDASYTQISIGEAERVALQLKDGLKKDGIAIESRIQGSVACDVHIRGVSDVDLLVLDDRYFRYSTSGVKARQNYYTSPVSYNTLDALVAMRQKSEKILEAAFPRASVDTKSAKAICLSGGSLRRSVDVVPANWKDTDAYQMTGIESDRGVEILDKYIPERIFNLPFKHIHLINIADTSTLGGLKKSIRLCKNVKAEAIESGSKIVFSSFDIAATMWNADRAALTVGIANELAILAEATRFLDVLARNFNLAKSLDVPDGTRKIFDSDEKLEGLVQLSLEMDDLAEKVSREQRTTLIPAASGSEEVLQSLRTAYITG